jgi:hypothetical protein
LGVILKQISAFLFLDSVFENSFQNQAISSAAPDDQATPAGGALAELAPITNIPSNNFFS